MFLESTKLTSLGHVLSDAVDRVASLEGCPMLGLSAVIDNAVWESLLYHLATDPLTAAELVAGFRFDHDAKASISAVLNGFRRSAVILSPLQEVSLAMSAAAFLIAAREWVWAELRERGCQLPRTIQQS